MKKLLLLALPFVCGGAFAQEACTTTLSPGANVASAVSSAPNGAVICLNAGSYGSVNFYGIKRSGYVTVRSTTNQDAKMAPQVGGSSFLRFRDLTLSNYILINSCSTDIQFLNSKFIGGTEGLAIDASSCASTTVNNYLFDGVDFTNTGRATWEGRLSVRGGNGTVIRNSIFAGVSAASPADGIQLVGNAKNVTIKNNVFDGILESKCSPVHCDAIQLYGAGPGTVIDGNRFANSDTFIMAPDGSSDVTVTNNVFDGTGAATYAYGVQLGSATNVVFSHNTLTGFAGMGFGAKSGMTPSQNCRAENNIFRDSARIYQNDCTGTVVVQSNMFSSSSISSGSGPKIATPKFVGGTNPTSWAGFKLTTDSPGINAGNDGKDMGALTSGTSTPATPTTTVAPPTNLKTL